MTLETSRSEPYKELIEKVSCDCSSLTTHLKHMFNTREDCIILLDNKGASLVSQACSSQTERLLLYDMASRHAQGGRTLLPNIS